MTKQNPATLTDYPETPDGTAPHHRERRDSKLGHIMSSIRQALANEQQKLFGDHSSPHDHQQEHLENLRRQDIAQRNRVDEEMLWGSDSSESMSPAVQTCTASKLNENNMGVDSHEAGKRWGWPGLGTFQGPEEQPEKLRRTSSNKHASDRMAAVEPKMEAATFEAIDNAAESESYGWPGIGYLPTPRK